MTFSFNFAFFNGKNLPVTPRTCGTPTNRRPSTKAKAADQACMASRFETVLFFMYIAIPKSPLTCTTVYSRFESRI